MNLSQQVDAVQSREDFILFARALLKDYREDRASWENQDLEAFLDAIAAWAGDMDGFYLNRQEATPAQPSWKVLAQILLAAKFYE